MNQQSLGQQLQQKQWPLSLNQGEEKKVSDKIKIANWPEKGIIVTAELIKDGQSIDKII